VRQNGLAAFWRGKRAVTEALLELRNVTAGYGAGAVVREISLRVARGGVVAIIGPNGHGKTTLLRTISGLVRPTAGEVIFDGRSIHKFRVDQIAGLGIAHIPQGDLIFPEMTVGDNLLMGAYLPSARTHARERLHQVYEIFPRLREREDQIASTLSGGERRMLGIGRGLMLGGQILLFDEPSLGLAPIAIEQIFEVINHLKSEGRTILIVEENVSRVIEMADRIYLLDQGKFVWQGPPSELELTGEILETYLGS
jgi:branched-chain amino acid transport system ATP-binding protein